MKKAIIWFIVLGTFFLINLFSGCSCNTTYHGIGYHAPAWSSGGTRIYYFRNDLTVEKHTGFLIGEKYEYKSNEWYFCSFDLNGGSRETIYKIGEFSGRLTSESWRTIMDVSSDGKILYSITTAIKNGIWIIDTDGSNDHQILSWGKNPRWAYNYSKIVFEGDGNEEGIWIMDSDGSNALHVLTVGSSPAFCDTNERMFYHIWPANGYGQIYCYSFPENSIDTLFEGIWPEWEKNGEEFVYCYLGLQIYNFLDSTTIPIEGGLYPRYSPNGEWIVYGRDDIGMTNRGNLENKEILKGYFPWLE